MGNARKQQIPVPATRGRCLAIYRLLPAQQGRRRVGTVAGQPASGYCSAVADLDLRLVRSFLAVAEESNITRAAARLHLAQQAVSAQVRQLESLLGAALLVRTSRGVLLTVAGQELAAGASRLIEDADAVMRRVQAAAQGQVGRLRIVSKPHATAEFAVEVVEAMTKAVPGIELDLVTVSTLPEELELLSSATVDAGFLWLPVGDDRLAHAVVRTDRRVVAVPADHRLAQQDSVTLANLADEQVIVAYGVTCDAVVRHWLAEPRPDGRPALRGPTVRRMEDGLLQVARSRGVWLAPEPISRYFPAPRVRWLPVTDAEPSQLAVVWTPTAPQPLTTRLIAEVRALTGWTSH
jgi:DNA-binding transcriptional LysR family regulator